MRRLDADGDADDEDANEEKDEEGPLPGGVRATRRVTACTLGPDELDATTRRKKKAKKKRTMRALGEAATVTSTTSKKKLTKQEKKDRLARAKQKRDRRRATMSAGNLEGVASALGARMQAAEDEQWVPGPAGVGDRFWGQWAGILAAEQKERDDAAQAIIDARLKAERDCLQSRLDLHLEREATRRAAAAVAAEAHALVKGPPAGMVRPDM